MKMTRIVLANVLLVGLERNIAMPQESITTLTVKNIRIENAKNTKKKTNSITITIKRKYEKKETLQKKDTCYDKNERYREGNREANRTTTKERYKRDKDKINTKRREWRKQKKEEQLLINQ